MQSIAARNLRSGQSIQSANLRSLLLDSQHRRSSSSVSSSPIVKQPSSQLGNSNFDGNEPLFDVYFALYTRSNREPFYVGDVLRRTCNPDWPPLDFSSLGSYSFGNSQTVLSADSVIIQIWARKALRTDIAIVGDETELDLDREDEKQFSLLVEWDVDFSGLVSIGGESHLQQFNFPENTILLRIGDDFYTAQQCLMSNNVVQLSSFSTMNEKFIKVLDSNAAECCSKEFIFESCRAERLIRERQDEISALEKRLDQLSLHKVRMQIVEIRQRISKLERVKRQQSTVLQDAARRRDKLKELLFRRKSTIQTSSEIRNHEAPSLDATRKILNEKDNALLTIESVMNTKCVDLVFQLQEIYPLQTINDELCLRNIPLSQLLQRMQQVPNDVKTHEDIATCLGHAAHLTMLLSRYLHVPLRYQIMPVGSRSYIIDEITTMPVHEPPYFPLFIQRAEKYRFDYAIMLLNRNIEQILNVLNEYEYATKDVLKNLLLIYEKLSKQ